MIFTLFKGLSYEPNLWINRKVSLRKENDFNDLRLIICKSMASKSLCWRKRQNTCEKSNTVTYMDVNMHLINGIQIYENKFCIKKSNLWPAFRIKKVCNLPCSKWLGTWQDTLTLIQLTADPYINHKPNKFRYKQHKTSFPIWQIPEVNQNKHQIGST